MRATIRQRVGTCGGLCVVMLAGACLQQTQTTTPAEPAAAPTVRIDPEFNGAAGAPPGADEAGEAYRPPRELAFVMQGTSRPPTGGSEHERRLAMSQAAVLEALAAAVAERRGEAVDSAGEFAARLGPRVTLTCRAMPSSGREIELRLNVAGSATVLRTRDGVLQHAPYDLKVLERIFEETRGEFALLATEPSMGGEEYHASVACYRPVAAAPAASPLPEEAGTTDSGDAD